jgi:RNA polymerase sigma-70 factor (ECF subfamily)
MKTHVASSGVAITTTILLLLCQAAAQPQTGEANAGQSGPAAAVAMLETVKAQYGEACAALLERNDAAAAAKLLADLEPTVKRVLGLLKGTEVEQEVGAGIKGLGELRKALEASETEQAKKLMQELGQFGGNLEPKIRALAAADSAAPAEKVTRLAHVEVTTSGISDAYANAIARTVEAARAVAIEQFGFDLPETIHVSAVADPKNGTRLFNDGEDHINLTIPSEAKLQRPAVTGIFHLYGFCHEVGHLAMYRVIHQRTWLSSAGTEGWAHYAGSRILDAVYAREGEQLWPDAYNYLEDGMARLRKQLAASKPDAADQTAGLWLSLVEILGDKGVAPLFSAWAKLSVDESKPGVEVGKAVIVRGDKDQLGRWWQKAEPVLVVASPKSGFAAQSKDALQLKTPPQELAKDDGIPVGKRSMAGSGHAVRFTAPGKESYLTAVRIYGSRYGQPQAPRENAWVWLCDAEFKKIAEFPCPYASFERGTPKWVTVPVKPVRVPPEFVVCVGFNPTATKGVFVHYDNGGSGSSFMALPGGKGRAFDQGDWLIRAVVQDAKD